MGQSSRKRKATTLIVIDFYDHTRGGHFGSMLHWYAQEFLSRVDRVIVCTPEPRVAQELFTEREERLGFTALPPKNDEPSSINTLFDDLVHQYPDDQLAAFFMWGLDIFLLSRHSAARSKILWATFGTFSRAIRDAESKMASYEKLTLEFFKAHPDCVAIAQPDPFLNFQHQKVLTVIDAFVPELSLIPCALSKQIQEFGQGRMLIGVVGQLYGFRGVHEILNLAITNPDYRFVLAGRLFEDSMHPDYLQALQEGRFPNLLFLPGFIQEEAHLHDILASLDGILIDGRNYPNQSGICYKASNSWTSDVIQRFAVGHIYSTHQDPFREKWEQWLVSGGPERSQQTIYELDKLTNNAQSLDRICSRLFPSQ
jgi:glycosyltransferase involved in cell wall biosynthesis